MEYDGIFCCFRVVLWISVFDFWGGTFLPPNDEQRKKGMTGYKCYL